MAKKKPRKSSAKSKKPKTEPEWRTVERVVAAIETSLAGTGAVVKSPDHLPDKVTGQPREVDVTIRYQVGSAPVVLGFECRKRNRAADVLWVEQVATKYKDISVDKAILVARKFYKPAALKAARYGMAIREIRDLSSSNFLPWLRAAVTVWNLDNPVICVTFYGQGPSGLMEEFVKRSSGATFEAALFVGQSGQDVSIGDVLRDWEKKPNSVNAMKDQGSGHMWLLHLDIAEGNLYVRGEAGQCSVKALDITGTFRFDNKLVYAEPGMSYTDQGKLIAETAHLKIHIEGQPEHVFVGMRKRNEAGEIVIVDHLTKMQ